MFRCVLPHEPPLQPSITGYALLQGALTPSKLASTDKAPSSSSLSVDYWIQHRDSFTAVLRERLKRTTGEQIQACELLDDQPPYTKVRLQFSSLSLAASAAAMYRTQSPQQLLLGTPYSTNSQRLLQVSLLTTESLPEPSWKRISPPKFRRLLQPGDEVEQQRKQTRFVVLTQLVETGTEDSDLTASIRAAVAPYDTSGGHGVEVFVPSHHATRNRYCHVGMRSPADAQAVVHGLQGACIKTADGNGIVSHRVFVDVAAITDRSQRRGGEAARPQCTSTTADVRIPGLQLIPDFLSEAEEAAVMAVLTGPQAPWAPSQRTATFADKTVRRAVQHYGYVFDYETADVLRDRTTDAGACPPLPAVPHEDVSSSSSSIQRYVAEGLGWNVMAGVVERTRRQSFDDDKKFPHLNQITVNCYRPGEGIGTHIDTPSAFDDGLISISLNSGIVMEFRERTSGNKKLVYLPRRSLLLMSGDARYEWEHMIVTRRTDTVDGVVQMRGQRVSLTLRTAIDTEGSPLPAVESATFPPVWGGSSNKQHRDTTDPLATPSCERDHVHAVYDAIATQWHHTRGKRGVLWPGATAFLQNLPPGSVVADVGCGDGKYFPAIWEAGSYVIGTDISEPLLKTSQPNYENDSSDIPESRRIAKERLHLRDRPAVAVGDCMNIPLRSSSCDAAICIAVLHHLSTFERRKRCLEELVRIVKPGGYVNVQAWAIDQDETSKRKFAVNDVFVPFNAQPKYLDIATGNDEDSSRTSSSMSTAQKYSKAFKKADYDDNKGLVVFKRYCHLYKKGELEHVADQVDNVEIVESGFESGNYYIILRTLAPR